jgi:hypothetical protein
MLEYVLVVYMFNDFKNPEYVGHFRDCKSATTYQKKHYPNHQSSKYFSFVTSILSSQYAFTTPTF